MDMRLVSWNVNGIRAAIRKGIDGYFSAFDADIIMLQEVRALPEQLPKGWNWPNGYAVHLHAAEKKGYSGVATLARTGFDSVETGMGGSLDEDRARDCFPAWKRDVRQYLSSIWFE